MQRLFATLILAVSAMGSMLAQPLIAQAQNPRAGSASPALSTAGVPATVFVNLPTDAKLTIDGQATTSTGAQRRFISPPIETGKEFHYAFRAEFVTDGKNVIAKEVVPVRAGRETVVWLGVPAPEARAFYFAPESQAPSVQAPRVFQYGSTAYPGIYPGGGESSPRVLPMSEQDPLKGTGLPGADDPNSARAR